MASDDKLFEILTKWNFWHKDVVEAGYTRELTKEILSQAQSPEIVALKGVRRSGKSTILLQLMNGLREKGIRPADVFYVNFEEPLFMEQQGENILERLYSIYRERMNTGRLAYVFLDEVQNIPRWEQWARVKADLREAKLFVTGSSAALLGSEYSILLTGRHLSYTVYPLSFREFLSFKGMAAVADPVFLAGNKLQIRNMLREYLQFGGFPEAVLREGTEAKEKLLKQYFEDLLYRDVVWRYRVRDIATLKNIALLCMTNMANLCSYNRIKNDLNVPLDVVRNYTAFMAETYLIREVLRHSFKVKEQLRHPRKIYAVDTGLRNAVSYRFSEDLGRIAENAVCLSLIRQDKDIYYYKNRGEVDFLVRQGMQASELIQVCMAGPDDDPAFQREILSLKEAMSLTPMAEGTIITDDRDETIDLSPGKIKCVPLWKWLLL